MVVDMLTLMELSKVLFNTSIKIYLFALREPTPATAGSARVNTKQRETRSAKKKKGIEAERAKSLTPTRAIGTLIGDEDQKKEKDRNRERVPNRAGQDHSVDSYGIIR